MRRDYISELQFFRRKWKDILELRKGCIPRKEIEKKITVLYTISGFRKPLFLWSLSPIECFFYFLEFIRKKYKEKVNENYLWYKTLCQKEIFFERAKPNFKDINHFEKFKKRIEINLRNIPEIIGDRSLKCKIFPIPECKVFFEKVKEYLNDEEMSAYRYYPDMGKNWGWMETIYSEINRIFSIEGFPSISLWSETEKEYIIYLMKNISYVGDSVFPSELLEFGVLPKKRVVPFLEFLYRLGKFKEQERKKLKFFLRYFNMGYGFSHMKTSA